MSDEQNAQDFKPKRPFLKSSDIDDAMHDALRSVEIVLKALNNFVGAPSTSDHTAESGLSAKQMDVTLVQARQGLRRVYADLQNVADAWATIIPQNTILLLPRKNTTTEPAPAPTPTPDATGTP